MASNHHNFACKQVGNTKKRAVHAEVHSDWTDHRDPSLAASLQVPPPPPPNTIKTANEGRFRLNVDSPYGERAQSTVLTRARPRRLARPRQDFIFNLSMRESKASPVVVCSPCRRKKALSTRCQLICWPLLPTFLGGLVTQPTKGRTSPWQMPAGQAGAANISWSASAGRRWCCCVQGFQNSTSLLPSCRKSLFWMCMALVTSTNMAGGACKCGVGSLVHRRKFDRSHSDAAVLCAAALVFSSLGQDLCNNQTNAGYPEGFGMVERSSLS